MFKHTEKRSTDAVELTLFCEEAFPEYDEDDYPGITLAGARMKEGLTQKKLSEIMGVP